MERDLFAIIYGKNGHVFDIGHFVDDLGERMCDYDTMHHTYMKRSTFLELIESLKNDERVAKVITWEGLLKGEYRNVHTGEIEKIWGF